ncbi:MAG TPA: IclR family transcriptional regulator [Candidatus Binatus sp.]|nr:IclR family transcriptional regulator [Candidatus Binatus sp.]
MLKPIQSARTYSSQVLDRVVRILECFGPERTDLRLVEIVAATGLHKSTLYRLLEAMRAHRLIGFDAESGCYHPGLKLFEIGSLAAGRFALERHAHPTLEHLATVSGETAHLCVLDGSDVVYVAKVECTRTLRIPSAVGQRNPAYCTGVGKAILAFLTPEQIESYIASTPLKPFTRKTLISSKELKANLGQVTVQGYAVDDQEREEGVRCVAAPVRDHAGEVIAAISIAGPSIRVTKERIAGLASHVVQAADEISAAIGYRVMPNGADKTAIRKISGHAARLNSGLR